jgi:signal transduction histidine kinase/CheY-like chemotaxis protein
MSIDIRQIRAEPHSEIGLLLERNADIIVDRWCERAKVEIPDAKRIHRDTLRDQLPRFVVATAQALRHAGDPSPTRYCESANEHGLQRWNTKWSLAELVRDYQLLQLVILEYLEDALERSLEFREIMAVTVHIDDAIAASITTYVETRDEHVRRLDKERVNTLQQTNHRKDEFIAILAHELRNSLAPICTSIDLLQLTLNESDPALNETLEILGRHAKQVTCLVDDLLDLARIAQGRFELRKQELDLATILKQAIDSTRHEFEARRHTLHVELPKAPLYVQADPARFVQIVVNLLHNAAKYTEPGGQTWLTAEKTNGEAVITVRDTGVGIPPQMVSRVFDMFVQVEESNHQSSGGLGIGLTLVQRLTELHGGTVTCSSSGLGHGSEFVVRLKATTEPSEMSPAEPLHDLPAASVSCRLIIIEDQSDARHTLALLLEKLGHSVEVAENGAEGIERALQFKPQAALVDIGLPDMNGYEVAKQLRAAFADRIFLVALTGYGQDDDLRTALDAGFDAHLTKPADIRELSKLLSRVASKQQ